MTAAQRGSGVLPPPVCSRAAWRANTAIMRIVCPACTATYDVPEARLAPGRAVRCARCGTDWLPLDTDAPVLPLPVEASPDVPDFPSTFEPPRMFDRPSVSRAPNASKPPSASGPAAAPAPPPSFAARVRRADTAVLAGWVASLALLAALGWGGVKWRNDVMHAWPPSERLYAALGLASGPAGQ